MNQNDRVNVVILLSILALALATAAPAHAQQTLTPKRNPDVAFVPTPPAVIEAMLKVASVTSKDVVYDLGCGDGRIVVMAAKTHGARCVGIDIDPNRIKEAEARAQEAGVSDLVSFREGDLFEVEISEASVVTLYLLPALNMKLRPKLWKELAVGTRIVSHAFSMGDWQAEEELTVDGRKVYFWTITEETKSRLAKEQ